MKLSIKFSLILELIVIISIVSIATLSYSIGVENIEHQLYNQLESVSILKSNQLENFFDEVKDDMTHLGHHVEEHLSLYNQNKSSFRNMLIEYTMDNNNFNEFFILDANGSVYVSTNILDENKLKSSEVYYLEGRDDQYLQTFYYDTNTGKPAVTIAQPIESTTLVVAIGRINISVISDIMAETSGLGQTGETYLVNLFNYAVSELKDGDGQLFSKTIYSEPVLTSLNEKTTTVQFTKNYVDYSGTRSVGSYVFLPFLNVCLITELDESEAFATMTTFRNNVVFIGIILILSSLIIGYLLIKQLTKSIFQLNNASKEITKGNLETPIKIISHDEIGSLAQSFENMRISLKDTQSHLIEYQKNLENKVAERTNQLDEKVIKLKQSEAANLNLLSDLNRNITYLEEAQKEIKKKNIALQKTQQELEMLNKDLESQVENRTEEITQLLKQKDEFIGQLGHDLKNPLGPLVTLLPVLEKKVSDEKEKEMLTVLQRNVNYMRNLVSKTLELARLNSPNTKLNVEKIHLNDQVEEILENNIFLFKEKDIQVKNNIPENLFIHADKLRLEEVFTNILSNSVKYSRPEGVITISAKQTDNEIGLSIQDTGIGMTKEQLERLFDEFYKADDSRHDFDSSGLGMPIAKRIIEKHGGRISVHSDGIGKGTTFTFTLPLNHKN